jgi:hypothetical protein
MDESPDREVDVVPLAVGVEFGHPQVWQATCPAPQLPEERAHIITNGPRVAAEGRPVCEGAEPIEPVGRAVPGGPGPEPAWPPLPPSARAPVQAPTTTPGATAPRRSGSNRRPHPRPGRGSAARNPPGEPLWPCRVSLQIQVKNGTLRVPSLPGSPPVTEPLDKVAFCAVTGEPSHPSLRRSSARITVAHGHLSLVIRPNWRAQLRARAFTFN